MSKVEARLREAGLELPPAPQPIGNYVEVVRTGNLLFLAGHGPVKDGQFVRGKVGSQIDVQAGYEAARLVALSILATIKGEIGDLDRVKRIVKVLGMVNCPTDFEQQPEVVNGASDVLVTAFGPERGKHARSAVGMGSLPRNIPVEVEVVVEVE